MSASEILSEYHIRYEHGITESDFLQLCPAIVFQVFTSKINDPRARHFWLEHGITVNDPHFPFVLSCPHDGHTITTTAMTTKAVFLTHPLNSEGLVSKMDLN